MVVFRVSDAGTGVPESFIPRLFERYSQGPGPRARRLRPRPVRGP